MIKASTRIRLIAGENAGAPAGSVECCNADMIASERIRKRDLTRNVSGDVPVSVLALIFALA